MWCCELCTSSHYTSGPKVKKIVPRWTPCASAYSQHDLPALFSSSSSSSSSSGLVATHTSLFQRRWHDCTVVVLFFFILIDWLLPSRRGKKASLIGHDTASQLSFWSMCAAWIQATALVLEAPSHSPWIHIAAHILLLLWCNCFVIAAQTEYNTVSI